MVCSYNYVEVSGYSKIDTWLIEAFLNVLVKQRWLIASSLKMSEVLYCGMACLLNGKREEVAE